MTGSSSRSLAFGSARASARLRAQERALRTSRLGLVLLGFTRLAISPLLTLGHNRLRHWGLSWMCVGQASAAGRAARRASAKGGRSTHRARTLQGAWASLSRIAPNPAGLTASVAAHARRRCLVDGDAVAYFLWPPQFPAISATNLLRGRAALKVGNGVMPLKKAADLMTAKSCRIAAGLRPGGPGRRSSRSMIASLTHRLLRCASQPGDRVQT
jgi:hypothetical protein